MLDGSSAPGAMRFHRRRQRPAGGGDRRQAAHSAPPPPPLGLGNTAYWAPRQSASVMQNVREARAQCRGRVGVEQVNYRRPDRPRSTSDRWRSSWAYTLAACRPTPGRHHRRRAAHGVVGGAGRVIGTDTAARGTQPPAATTQRARAPPPCWPDAELARGAARGVQGRGRTLAVVQTRSAPHSASSPQS